MQGYPSGQRDQTVNLPASAFDGSNPSPCKAKSIIFYGGLFYYPQMELCWGIFALTAPYSFSDYKKCCPNAVCSQSTLFHIGRIYLSSQNSLYFSQIPYFCGISSLTVKIEKHFILS